MFLDCYRLIQGMNCNDYYHYCHYNYSPYYVTESIRDDLTILLIIVYILLIIQNRYFYSFVYNVVQNSEKFVSGILNTSAQ